MDTRRRGYFHRLLSRLTGAATDPSGYVQILDLPHNLMRLDFENLEGVQVPVFDGRHFAHAIFKGAAKNALKTFLDEFANLPPESTNRETPADFSASAASEFTTACSEDLEEDFVMFAQVRRTRLVVRLDSIESHTAEFVFVFTEIEMRRTITVELMRTRLPNRLFPVFLERGRGFYDSKAFFNRYLVHRCVLNEERDFRADPTTKSVAFKLLDAWKKVGVALQLSSMDTGGQRRLEPFVWCPRSYVELKPYSTERELALQLGKHVLEKVRRIRERAGGDIRSSIENSRRETALIQKENETIHSQPAPVGASRKESSSAVVSVQNASKSSDNNALDIHPAQPENNLTNAFPDPIAITAATSVTEDSDRVVANGHLSQSNNSSTEPLPEPIATSHPTSVTTVENVSMGLTEYDELSEMSSDNSAARKSKDSSVVSSTDTFLTSNSRVRKDSSTLSLFTEDEDAVETRKELMSKVMLRAATENPQPSSFSSDSRRQRASMTKPLILVPFDDSPSIGSSAHFGDVSIEDDEDEMSRLESIAKPQESSEQRRLESLTDVSTVETSHEGRRLSELSFVEGFREGAEDEDSKDGSFETVSQMDMAGVSSFYAIRSKGSPKRSSPLKRSSTPLIREDEDELPEPKKKPGCVGKLLSFISPRRPIRKSMICPTDSSASEAEPGISKHSLPSGPCVSRVQATGVQSQPDPKSQLDFDEALDLLQEKTQHERAFDSCQNASHNE